MVATQTLWLDLVAGVESRWLASRGDAKRKQYQALKNVLHVMREKAKGQIVQGRLGYA